jgi:hypothetical protein
MRRGSLQARPRSGRTVPVSIRALYTSPRLVCKASMFDYYESEGRTVPRNESWNVKWGIRASIMGLVAASVLLATVFAPIYFRLPWQKTWLDYSLFLAITTGAIAWGILVLRLESRNESTWLYGFLTRMAKALLIVIGCQILTVAFIILFFNLTGWRVRSEVEPSRQLQAPWPRAFCGLQPGNAAESA